MKDKRRGILLSALGTLFFSTSPILTRFAAGLPVGEIAFFRMLFGSLFIFIAAKATGVDLRLSRRDLPKFLLYGLATSFHFLFYIGSVLYTTIAHSLSLVYTAPIMITVMTAVLLKEKIPRYKYLGIIIVILGIIILTGFEPVLTPEMVLGDVMALLSALCLAVYSVAGRRERDNYPLLKYVFWVYFTSALFLLAWALPSFVTPSSWTSWAALTLLGLLPTTLGHTLYNAGIRHIHPAYANLISTQEITGGVLMGSLIFGETPGKTTVAGILIMFAGLVLVLVENTGAKIRTSRRKR
ncbi:DMT family transporter [Thermosediminibacter litoriperuensis]|uniref:DMT family transporter n=1 Tax=Thermosediminibacter litoriperuensis TaxID=291989 RepID=UPI0014796A72|nr:DMT family transporter [Thermosediminibacter litoriperuensis]